MCTGIYWSQDKKLEPIYVTLGATHCVCVLCRHTDKQTQTSSSISIAAKGGAEGGSLWLLDVCSGGRENAEGSNKYQFDHHYTIAPSHRVGG